MRVLFEKAVSTIPKEKAREIWNMYLAFESSYGDLSSMLKLEKRKAEAYPETDSSAIFQLVQRYKYMDLWPCSASELDSFGKFVVVPIVTYIRKNHLCNTNGCWQNYN